jgi:hypothetical protein
MIGWALAFAWAFAWRWGDSSQHATCPHSRHIRRCSQGVPTAKHSSHPSTDSGSRLSLMWARCPHQGMPTQGRTNTYSRDSHRRAISKCRHATRRTGEPPVAGARTTRVTVPAYAPWRSDQWRTVLPPRLPLARVRRAGVAADPRQVGACGSIRRLPRGEAQDASRALSSWARPSRTATERTRRRTP